VTPIRPDLPRLFQPVITEDFRIAANSLSRSRSGKDVAEEQTGQLLAFRSRPILREFGNQGVSGGQGSARILHPSTRKVFGNPGGDAEFDGRHCDPEPADSGPATERAQRDRQDVPLNDRASQWYT